MSPVQPLHAQMLCPSPATSAIDAVARCEDSRWERFLGVTDKVLKQEITWDRIAVLIYVAGKLAGKLARKLAIEVGPELVQLVLWLDTGHSYSDTHIGNGKATFGLFCKKGTEESMGP